MMMRQKKAGRFGGLPFLEKHRSKKGRFVQKLQVPDPWY